MIGMYSPVIISTNVQSVEICPPTFWILMLTFNDQGHNKGFSLYYNLTVFFVFRESFFAIIDLEHWFAFSISNVGWYYFLNEIRTIKYVAVC